MIHMEKKSPTGSKKILKENLNLSSQLRPTTSFEKISKLLEFL